MIYNVSVVQATPAHAKHCSPLPWFLEKGGRDVGGANKKQLEYGAPEDKTKPRQDCKRLATAPVHAAQGLIVLSMHLKLLRLLR